MGNSRVAFFVGDSVKRKIGNGQIVLGIVTQSDTPWNDGLYGNLDILLDPFIQHTFDFEKKCRKEIKRDNMVVELIPELTEKISKTYMSRSWDVKEIPHHLEFSRKIGDVILLGGKYQLVTGYGIYSNQMMTERYYEDGIRLGASDYAMVEKSELILDTTIREMVIDSYIEVVTRNFEKYHSKFISKNILDIHLSQFIDIKAWAGKPKQQIVSCLAAVHA